ncbi:hypothetical protein FRC09_009120 [Ceratobasidium sp. 395]|nr:hypothetical protein FRC09_009120 [Ceratobasidium sp. 395]
MAKPASATTIPPVSSIRTRFGSPMTQPSASVVLGEGSQLARAPGAGMDELVDNIELRLPPIRTLPPIQTYGQGLATVSAAEEMRRAMRGGGAGISRDVLLYGPAGMTSAPTELARNNMRDKLPSIPSSVPPRQATFLGAQSVPVADGSGRFATICASPRVGVPVPSFSRPVYPLIAGHAE